MDRVIPLCCAKHTSHHHNVNPLSPNLRYRLSLNWYRTEMFFYSLYTWFHRKNKYSRWVFSTIFSCFQQNTHREYTRCSIIHLFQSIYRFIFLDKIIRSLFTFSFQSAILMETSSFSDVRRPVWGLWKEPYCPQNRVPVRLPYPSSYCTRWIRKVLSLVKSRKSFSCVSERTDPHDS